MANPTSNFGWQMPTPVDLVTDLPADFEVFGQAVDSSLADLKGGTSGQVLSKNSNTDMDFVWVTSDDANAIQNTIVDAKGDLIAASAADTPARLAVGSNTAVLTADSTASTGLAWEGVWQNWTASITGITVGNGSVISRYRKIGKTVEIFFKFTMGSTSSLGALNYFALPFTKYDTPPGGFIAGGISDVGTTDYTSFAEMNGNNCILAVPNASTTYLKWTRIDGGIPMTWATGDFIWVSFTYEVA